MLAHAVVAVNATVALPNAVAAAVAVFGLHPVVVMVPRHGCSIAWHVVGCPALLEPFVQLSFEMLPLCHRQQAIAGSRGKGLCIVESSWS